MTGEEIEQNFISADGRKKGIRTILSERGLWRNELKLECDACKSHTTLETVLDCCARRLLSQQPDFKAQQEWLTEAVQSSGHRIIFYPKFHCELNFIELTWAYLKNTLRATCTFKFDDLEKKVPNILDGIPVAHTRRRARFCFRYMDGYRQQLTGRLLDFAVKQYKSHDSQNSTGPYRGVDEGI